MVIPFIGIFKGRPAVDNVISSIKDAATTRVKTLRLMTGFNRAEFSKHFEISQNTIQAWEQGKTKLTEKGAKRLITAAKAVGVMCSIEWLLDGAGPAPFYFEEKSTSEHNENSTFNLDLSGEILDVESFRLNNPGSIVYCANDNSMLPFYAAGDYVGGRQYQGNYPALNGINCIVSCKEMGTFIRKLIYNKNSFFLIATNLNSESNNLLIDNMKIDFLAPVIWHRSMRLFESVDLQII